MSACTQFQPSFASRVPSDPDRTLNKCVCTGTCSSVSMSKMRSARRRALVYLLLAGFSRPALKAMLPWSFSSPAVQTVLAQHDELQSLLWQTGGGQCIFFVEVLVHCLSKQYFLGLKGGAPASSVTPLCPTDV